MRCPWAAAAVGAAGRAGGGAGDASHAPPGATRSPRVKNVLISVAGLLWSPHQPPLPGQKNLSVSLLSEKYGLCSDKAAL